MAFNGAGVFRRIYSFVEDAAAGIPARASRFDDELNGFADGLSNCVTRDGQSPLTRPLPLGGQRLTAVGEPMQANDGATRNYVDVTALPAAIHAPNDGVTSANASIAAAGSFSLRAGLYLISDNLTISVDLIMMPGARFTIAAGKTLTITGSLMAPVAQIFTGAGTVDLTRARCPEAYPEWWGAVQNDATVDCADALEACHAAHPVMRLHQADYFIRRTVTFATSYRTVRGSGRTGVAQGQGTRIILQALSPVIGSADIIQHGPAVQPADRSLYPYEVRLENLTVVRDGRCTPPATAIKAKYPAGVRSSFNVHSWLRQVASFESSLGFYIGGSVQLKVDDCLAQRYLRGNASSAPDYSTCYYLDGTPNIGLAGGNASLYMHRNLASGTVALDPSPNFVDERGCEGQGAFVDTFLDLMETANTASGIVFSISGATQVGQTVDLHIRGAVVDGVSVRAIEINLGPIANATASACVEIIDPYIYARAAGADRGILIYDGAGSATITGGQIHGNFTAGSLWLSNTRNITSAGLKIHQATKPVVLATCSALDIKPQINDTNLAAGNYAITATTLARSILSPAVISTPNNEFLGGVSLSSDSDHNEVNPTKIDTAAVGGTAATKVVFNGADARGNAAFTAAGNVLTGATG